MSTGAALAGGLAIGSHGIGQRVSRAAQQGRQFTGQVVISIIQNPPDLAKQALADAYREQQPGVEVIWETRNTTPGDYVTYLGTQLAADEIRPDLVSSGYVGDYRGYVNFDRYRKTINPYTGNPWDEDLDFDFYRSINSLGERIQLASRGGVLGWFYNKDLFAKAEVEPPTTWSGLVEVCATLKEAGITPISVNYVWGSRSGSRRSTSTSTTSTGSKRCAPSPATGTTTPRSMTPSFSIPPTPTCTTPIPTTSNVSCRDSATACSASTRPQWPNWSGTWRLSSPSTPPPTSS
jgi:hypothetical protein